MGRTIPVGIDLGTTFSAVSFLDDSGTTTMLRNAEGDLLTPSVVLFGEHELAVGKDARNVAALNPELVAEWVKRDMGAPYYSRPIHGQYLPPEVIEACILRKIRGDIHRALGSDVAAVITVPAYFDEPRRKATADAGEMAGLRVLDIVNEPTAAALAFGEALGYLDARGATKPDMTILVYDLGGGTFDVTLLRLTPGRVETLATDGDVQLGGHDWDLRLVDYAAAAFQQAHGIDPRHDARAMNRLLAAAIDTKHALSARNRALLPLEYQGKTLELEITRERFAELSADLLERTAYTTRQLLADAKVGPGDVSRVLLVGGSTRMPMVAEMLRALLGQEPERTVNPDEAVARGAALYAGYLLAKAGVAPAAAFEVRDVNSHSLGVEGIDPDTMRRVNVVLIPRNTALPAMRTERFTTKSDNQTSIAVQVLEGESSLPGECTAIGRTVIRDLQAGLPKGWPVEVTFEYGTNGRLSVRAVVAGTDHAASLELERAVGLSGAGVARWQHAIEQSAGFDQFRRTAAEVAALGAMAGGTAAASVLPLSQTTGAPPISAAPASAPGAAGPLAGNMGFVPVGGDQPAAPPIYHAPAAVESPRFAPGATGGGSIVATAEPAGVQLAADAPPEGSFLAAPRPLLAPTDTAPAASTTGGNRAGRGPVARSAAARAAAARRPGSWGVLVVGYVTSAAAGLALGYLVLHLLRPWAFPLPW